MRLDRRLRHSASRRTTTQASPPQATARSSTPSPFRTTRSKYDVAATGPLSGTRPQPHRCEPTADLDQFTNRPAPSPNTYGCDIAAGDWVNGNLVASKASCFEGDSLPYRVVFGSLVPASSHTITIAWDTTKGDKHALDYLTTFNRTVANANPCLGVPGCVRPPRSHSATSSHRRRRHTGSRRLHEYNATITDLSAYAASVGPDRSAPSAPSLHDQSDPVLGRGARIADRVQWGVNNSAAAIKGSPSTPRSAASTAVAGPRTWRSRPRR